MQLIAKLEKPNMTEDKSRAGLLLKPDTPRFLYSRAETLTTKAFTYHITL